MQKNNFDRSKRDFLKKCVALSGGAFCLRSSVFSVNIEDQGIYRREAMFQQETARGTMCLICPNECVLKEGELSQCNNRKVHKSKLYTLAYGNPCSVAIDPIEKKPLYHFLPGSRAYSIATAGCNFACLNCQNWSISQTSPDKTRNYNLMPDKVVADCIDKGCNSIAYTYSEPVSFYEYVYETAVLARKAGIKNIVKSNGYIKKEPLEKWCSVLDAANIDLKSFNENTYLRLTGGKLQPVLDSLIVYKEMGIWLEITYLVVPAWTDNLDEIRKMCRWLNDKGFGRVPIHFSRFYPTYKLEQLPPTPVETLNKAVQIAKEEGLTFCYTGNVPGNELSDTFCPDCRKMLISRQGYRITAFNLKNGKCPECGRLIDGVWN